MKIISKSLILFLGALLACKNHAGTVWVSTVIYELNVPVDGMINQDIAIEVKTQTTNGCMHGVQFIWIEKDDRHIVITARGLHPAEVVACPAVIGFEDSVMVFRPAMTGKYFFQANESPLELKLDTLEVN